MKRVMAVRRHSGAPLLFVLVLALLFGCRKSAEPAAGVAALLEEGSRFEAAGDWRGAVAAYGNIVFGFPDWERADEIQLKVGELYLRLGDPRQAEIEFEHLRKAYPKSPFIATATYRVAESLFKEGRVHEAARTYYQFIKDHPLHPLRVNAAFYLANCYEETGALSEALQIYENLKGWYSNPGVLDLKIEKIKERRKKLGRG